MRDIKFRAWLKKQNEMVYFPDYYFCYEYGLLSFDVNDEHKYAGIANFPEEVEKENIMQFTGLKDKNGKDVYEGDIVNYNSCGFIHRIGEVFYINGKYRCGIPGLNVQDLAEHIHLTEIIGNIYENPELLNN